MTAEQAWDQMRNLAKLLRTRQPIPDELAEFLADAIEATQGKDIDAKSKGKAFTDELQLTANNRRKADLTPAEAQVERDFSVLPDAYPSQTQAAEHLAAAFKISKSTATSRLREADEATARDIEALRGE